METIRSATDALNRRDLETVLGLLDPEVAGVPLSGELEAVGLQD